MLQKQQLIENKMCIVITYKVIIIIIELNNLSDLLLNNVQKFVGVHRIFFINLYLQIIKCKTEGSFPIKSLPSIQFEHIFFKGKHDWEILL